MQLKKETFGRFSISLRTAVRTVALVNLAYFFVEFSVAENIGSVSLFADSIDFLEDAAVNFLIVSALTWTAKYRAIVGMILSGVLLIPTFAFLWTIWIKFNSPVVPNPLLLSGTGLVALMINLGCAFLLAKFRNHVGSLTRAAFLSARNDAFANIAIVGAGLVTLQWSSVWPDIIVGVGIAYMNVDAAKAIWKAAKEEQLSAKP